MSMAQAMLPEFDQEMAGTRKVLGRIPDDKLDWKAHKKSNTIGSVASHLSNIPSWVGIALNQNAFDSHPPGQEPYRTAVCNSRSEILDKFDQNVAEARELIGKATDEQLMQMWSLKRGGETLFTMPRMAVLRSFVLNHMIHHRAHLCVYLRLNDIPVPGLYGPSADDDGK